MDEESNKDGRDGPDYLTGAFHNAIDRGRREFDITYAEVIGCLESVKFDILREMEDEDDDEENELT